MSCYAEHEAMKRDPIVWDSLPLVGVMPVEAGDDPAAEPAYQLVMKNCTKGCGSTLCVEVSL